MLHGRQSLSRRLSGQRKESFPDVEIEGRQTLTTSKHVSLGFVSFALFGVLCFVLAQSNDDLRAPEAQLAVAAEALEASEDDPPVSAQPSVPEGRNLFTSGPSNFAHGCTYEDALRMTDGYASGCKSAATGSKRDSESTFINDCNKVLAKAYHVSSFDLKKKWKKDLCARSANVFKTCSLKTNDGAYRTEELWTYEGYQEMHQRCRLCIKPAQFRHAYNKNTIEKIGKTKPCGHWHQKVWMVQQMNHYCIDTINSDLCTRYYNSWQFQNDREDSPQKYISSYYFRYKSKEWQAVYEGRRFHYYSLGKSNPVAYMVWKSNYYDYNPKEYHAVVNALKNAKGYFRALTSDDSGTSETGSDSADDDSSTAVSASENHQAFHDGLGELPWPLEEQLIAETSKTIKDDTPVRPVEVFKASELALEA